MSSRQRSQKWHLKPLRGFLRGVMDECRFGGVPKMSSQQRAQKWHLKHPRSFLEGVMDERF